MAIGCAVLYRKFGAAMQASKAKGAESAADAVDYSLHDKPGETHVIADIAVRKRNLREAGLPGAVHFPKIFQDPRWSIADRLSP